MGKGARLRMESEQGREAVLGQLNGEPQMIEPQRVPFQVITGVRGDGDCHIEIRTAVGSFVLTTGAEGAQQLSEQCAIVATRARSGLVIAR